jgi:hypothetical protein
MKSRISALYLIMLTTLILSAFTVSVNAQDEAVFDVPILQDSDIFEGTFEEGVYSHLYAFWGTTESKITITMDRLEDSMVDPYLILLSANGQLLAVDDDGGPSSFSAMIADFELPEDGMYIIWATFSDYVLMSGTALDAEILNGEEFLEPMAYEIYIDGTDIPGDVDDPEISEIMAERIAIGRAHTVEINHENPLALVVFEALGGEIVTISALPTEGQVDTLLYLFDVSGESLAFNDDGAANTLYSEIAEFESPDDGIYLIVATSYQFYNSLKGDWSNVGEFQITIQWAD